MPDPIPLIILRDLLCGHCNKFVSSGPVHVTPHGQIICGRCERLAKSEYRNVAYEAVAKLFTYPCCNWQKHCPIILHWNESAQHEIKCIYNSSCRLFWTKPSVLCKSTKRLPDNSDLKLENITDGIIEILKCLLCESYLSRDPVYITSNGKNLCHRCITANGVPSSGAIRNLPYEKIASITIFPCIYRNRGCAIRARFGMEMWQHEIGCSYGQIYKKNERQPSQIDGKSRGVIKTHSGHIFGTITPNSPLFAPPTTASGGYNVENELLKKELYNHQHMFKRQQSIDSQDSLESILSGPIRGSMKTNIDEIFPDAPVDYRLNKQLSVDGSLDGDSIISGLKSSRDSSFRGHYQDNLLNHGQYNAGDVSRANSRPPTREDDYQPRIPISQNSIYNKPQNFEQYAHFSHFPAIYSIEQNPMRRDLHGTNNIPQIVVRNDSLRIGNSAIIEEIKARHQKKKRESQLDVE